MGKRKQRESQEEVDGERLLAESADDQEQKFLRHCEEVIEQLGPVKFRHVPTRGCDGGQTVSWASSGRGPLHQT